MTAQSDNKHEAPFANPEVAAVYAAHPSRLRAKLLFLRRLVLETADQTEGVDAIEETLKWGEPSYIAKTGSAIRIGWKSSRPTHYALLFNCQTKLVDTFRELYTDTFCFEGNRAIVFAESDEVPVAELKHCISLALTYRRRKHLWMLGV